MRVCAGYQIQVLRNCPADSARRVQVTRQFLQNADDIWVVSHTVRDYMEQVFQVEPERMRVIRVRFRYILAKLAGKTCLVRSSMRFRDTAASLCRTDDSEKCILELVKAYDLLQRRHYEIRLY